MHPEQGRRIEIHGIVQGVGFRPRVYQLAHEIGIAGTVRNSSEGVVIEAFGAPAALDEFLDKIIASPPAAASIHDVFWQKVPVPKVSGFQIVESDSRSAARVSIPADLATCPECLAEVFDRNDRRYLYPFANCTNCGPRFTIARDVPYDRANTTMERFPMCDACRQEYESPADRRFHAQPIACPDCGPKLKALSPSGDEMATRDPVAMAARAIRAQLIVAVKGLGGFHLACDATSATAVHRLRERKRRDAKPFAVMVRDMAAAETIAQLSDDERALLQSTERPVVLARRRAGSGLAEEIAPSNPLVGLMLPYTPLHHLLLAATARPLVMTSANFAEEPIVSRNEEALERLRDVADLFLVHDREIENRCDDSVVRIIAGGPVLLRRSRGYVPQPIRLARPVARPTLGCGSDLKNVFCLASGDSAFLGPHIGDLENEGTTRCFDESLERLQRFVRVQPEVIAYDLHPGYYSSHLGRSTDRLAIGIQHHHAHVASVMAEQGLEGPVIGVAYDGTGYGTDGEAWGGEIMIADFEGFERVATFRAIPLAGADTAIRQVWRIALAVLDDAFEGAPPLHELALFAEIPSRALGVVRTLVEKRLQSPLAHGVGRYFDAFGALALVRSHMRYEGQVALEWNAVADRAEKGRYPFEIDCSRTPWELDFRPMVKAFVAELLHGVGISTLSGRFHNTIAEATSAAVALTAAQSEKLPVVLSGGCFQNDLLTESIVQRLSPEFRVHLARNVPPGDGGISLGQVVIADALLRAEKRQATQYRLVKRTATHELAVGR